MNLKWLAQRTIYSDSTDLVLVQDMGDKIGVAKPMEFTMELQSRHAVINEPTLRLRGDQGQSLMQALWDAGLRPNDGAGSGAEVQAIKNHAAFAERVADRLLVHVTTGTDERASE